jgi:hypothetical protein
MKEVGEIGSLRLVKLRLRRRFHAICPFRAVFERCEAIRGVAIIEIKHRKPPLAVFRKPKCRVESSAVPTHRFGKVEGRRMRDEEQIES